jgi:hypothetical protein
MSTSDTTIQTCEDGHRCENGSMCTENPYDEGGFYCDCDQGNIDAVYAGLYCEHQATSYCTFNQEVSMISFCTNDGQCKVEVSADSGHLGCDCPSGYEGDHCQFVEGAKPDGWPFDGSQQQNLPSNQTSSQSGGGLQGGVVAVIVIIVLGFVGGVGYMIYRKKKGLTKTVEKHNIPSSELVLEADGSVLKESMRMSNGTASYGDHDNVDTVEPEGAMEDINFSGSTDDGGASGII